MYQKEDSAWMDMLTPMALEGGNLQMWSTAHGTPNALLEVKVVCVTREAPVFIV
jgi:hypothetical protein